MKWISRDQNNYIINYCSFIHLSSTKNRFLEQNLNYTEMMNETAASYLEDSSDIAEYIHEDLYKSDMELMDVLHYMTDEPSDYLRYRLDIYSENKISEYKGIDKFFIDAFQAYGSLNHITLYSYTRDETTEYTRDGKSYRRKGDADFKRMLEESDLVGEDCFSERDTRSVNDAGKGLHAPGIQE